MKNYIWKFSDNITLILYSALLVLVLFIFYPSFFSIRDEQAYLSTAYALGKGTPFLDKAGLKIGQRLISDFKDCNLINNMKSIKLLLLLSILIVT